MCGNLASLFSARTRNVPEMQELINELINWWTVERRDILATFVRVSHSFIKFVKAFDTRAHVSPFIIVICDVRRRGGPSRDFIERRECLSLRFESTYGNDPVTLTGETVRLSDGTRATFDFRLADINAYNDVRSVRFSSDLQPLKIRWKYVLRSRRSSRVATKIDEYAEKEGSVDLILSRRRDFVWSYWQTLCILKLLRINIARHCQYCANNVANISSSKENRPIIF